MNKNAVLLTDCPTDFQDTVHKKIEDYTKLFGNCEIMSVISLEDTPYIDKSIVSKRSVLSCMPPISIPYSVTALTPSWVTICGRTP